MRFVATSALGGVIAVFIFNLLASRKLEEVMYAMRLPSTSTSGVLMQEAIYTNLFTVLFIVVAFIVTAGGLFKKINGPLRKLAAEVGRIAKGNLSAKVKLRYKDEFHDFADELNAMTDELNGRFQRIREHVREINELAVIGGTMECKSLEEKLARQIEGLEEEVQAFTT